MGYFDNVKVDVKSSKLLKEEYRMIAYSVSCIFCKKTFEVVEGTKKYTMYKRNMKGKFSCDDCDTKIEFEARKGLLGKL